MDRKNTIFRHKLAGTWYRVVHCIWIFPFFKNQKIQIAVNVKCDQPFLPFFLLYWLYIIWMYFYVRPYDKWGWFNNVTILSFIVRSINWISKTKQSSDIYFFHNMCIFEKSFHYCWPSMVWRKSSLLEKNLPICSPHLKPICLVVSLVMAKQISYY